MSWLEFLDSDSSGIANCVTKSLTVSLSLSWSYHVSSTARKTTCTYDSSSVLWTHWNQKMSHSLSQKKKPLKMENKSWKQWHYQAGSACPCVRKLDTGSASHFTPPFHSCSPCSTTSSCSPVQQHHHQFYHPFIDLYINFKILSTQLFNHQLTRLIDIITIFIVTSSSSS